MQLEKSLKIA